VPPLTGASSMAMLSDARRSAIMRAANGSMVAMHSTMWPGLAPRIMPCAPMITDSACSVVSTMTMVRSAAAATASAEGATSAPLAFNGSVLAASMSCTTNAKPGLRQIERHRAAHGAEPDESDLSGHACPPWSPVWSDG